MQLLIKSIFVIATFFLHYLVTRDMTLHGGFHFAPILSVFFMGSVFLTAWSILLWNRKRGWILESVISLLLGVLVWWIMIGVPQDEAFLVGMTLLLVAFFAFVLVDEFNKPLIEKYIPKLFFIATIIGAVIAIATVLFKDDLGGGFIGVLIFLPLALAGGLIYGVVLPFIKIMFPLYVWVFIKTDKKLFTRYGAILIIFQIVAFFTSSHGTDAIQSIGNPCYEIVEGKAPSYVIRGDNVCIVEGGTGLSTSYLKPLEGADAKSFEDVGGGYAKDKNHVYKNGIIDGSLDPKTLRSIDHGYVTDDHQVSYGYSNVKIPGVDPKTFTILGNGNYYSKDAQRVYYTSGGWRILDGADVQTFKVLVPNEEYAKDQYHVYYAGRVLEDIDASSFNFIGERFSRDDNHILCNGVLLKELDAHLFQRIGKSDYLRDADTLYYCDMKVEGIDIQNFRVLPASKELGGAIGVWEDTCGTDMEVVVCDGRVQEGEDPSTFFSNPVSL